ncbi:MAG TPA: hypothetical protein VF636_08555 [Sphingomonas sp.]|jgi:hypothetical protein
MKTVSKALMSALLLTGVAAGAIVAQPAAAQKNKKVEGPAPPKLSKEVQAPAAAAQTALKANDVATAEPLIAQAEAAAKTDDERYVGAALRVELESKKIAAQQAANPNATLDETRLAAPLDVLLASPRVDQAQKARLAFARGRIAYNGKAYPQAVQYFQQAQQLGSTESQLGMLIAQAKELGGDRAGALADVQAQLRQASASGQKAPEEQYRYALARAIKVPGQGLPAMVQYLQAYPTAKNWRDMVITYGFANDGLVKLDTPQKIDLFRLMRASKSLADQYDYLEYAQKTRDRGLPAESLAVLREGTAAGKLPAANTEVKAMTAEVTRQAAAEGSLTGLETKARAAGDGKLAAQTAEAYLSQGQYAKAAELYRAALQKGGVNADEVNTRLGIALANSGDKAGAKAAFGAVQGAPRKDIALLWTTWLDTTA